MFKRNDGKGVNATQNRFTALLKKALHNHKVDYIIANNKRIVKEVPIIEYTHLLSEDSDFIDAIINYDTVRSALKTLTDRERKIIILHILEDKDFAEIGKQLGLSYKGTATAFYRALNKLRNALGRYRDEF